MVNSKPFKEMVSPERVKEISERTVNGGAEIVSYLKTGSAFYAPAASAARMVEAVLDDSKELINCSTYLDGEYGLKDVTIGVPVRLGSGGIETIIELELEANEREAFLSSADTIKKTISELDIA